MPPSSTPFTHPAVSSRSVFNMDIFNGKVLFCTGGGSGICKAMTEAMMHHGVEAAIVGRNIERLVQASQELSKLTGKACLPVQADVRKHEQLRDAVAKTLEKFGRIDFVICGAAGNFLAPIENLSENAFRTVMEIDTIGTYQTIKATLSHVRESHGAYIHVSAMLHFRGTPYQAHVSAAKAGVDALSNVLAVEEGPRGVRSNVISPGPVANTVGMDRLTSTAKGASEATASIIPLQRMGHVMDIANATVFLFSDAASWITGQVLAVDGGEHHIGGPMLPYPSSVLDIEGSKELIKAKM